MRILPKLRETKNKDQSITRPILGIDKTENFKEGALLTSENICLSSFPAITAGKRKDTPKLSFDESLFYIPTNDGTLGFKKGEENDEFHFLYESASQNKEVSMTAVHTESTRRVEAQSVGKKVVIFPHKVCFEEVGSEANRYYTAKGEMEKSFSLKGNSYGTDLFLAPDRIMVNQNNELWETLKSTFSAGDVLTINGTYRDASDDIAKAINVKAILREFKEEITMVNPVSVSYYLKFDGNTFTASSTATCRILNIEIKKTVPDLMNLSTFSGRVWGNDKLGKIYASKYNDPTNFEYFNLTSADSFTLETDTPGDFIASFPFGDHLLFFKEDKIHRITGTKPSNFRHSVITTNGVKCGAEKTIAAKDDIVYYVGTDGVYAFAGGTAVKISEPIGDIDFKDGHAFFYKDIYYLTVKNEKGEELFGYDTKKRMWFKDGSFGYKSAFFHLGNTMVQASDNKIYTLSDEADLSRDMSITLREFSDFYPNAKGTYKLFVLASLSGGKLIIEADFGFGFETVGSFTDERKTIFEIPLKPNRGEKISIRLTLSPEATLRGIIKRNFYHGIHK